MIFERDIAIPITAKSNFFIYRLFNQAFFIFFTPKESEARRWFVEYIFVFGRSHKEVGGDDLRAS